MSVTFTSAGNQEVSSVYTFGRATEGQLGTHDFNDKGSPTDIGIYQDVIQVVAGPFSSAILTKSKILVFGRNVVSERNFFFELNIFVF